MVEAVDQSVLAQLGPTDMRLPIQFAFTWPGRVDGGTRALDFTKMKDLTFEKPDTSRFPCLALAYKAGRQGGGAPAVLNAANEIAVQAFLDGRLAFMGIPALLRRVLARYSKLPQGRLTLDAILRADSWARRDAAALVDKGKGI
jgi:1-deoxy-D-xylulose-5-phosphate reductoisomerase